MISSTLRRRNVGNAAEFKNHPSLLHCTNEYDAVVNQLPDCTDLSVTQPQDDDDPAEENRDLISQLPDNILIKILGCMDTSCATSTSILSNRWRNLYKQVPHIDLNCSGLLRHIPAVRCGSSILSQTSWTNLHKFVSNIEWGISDLLGWHCADQIRHDPDLLVDLLGRFLNLRCCSGSNIRSVRLRCCLDHSVSTRFEQCIYSLKRLGVEKLVLHCCCCCCRELIYPLFSSHIVLNMPSSLKYLELGCCHLTETSQYCNSSLQSLVLSDVSLYRGALECILFNCSSLRALTISGCEIWSSKLIIRGPNLPLKRFYVINCKRLVRIELCASNLVVFGFACDEMVDFVFDHVPQLQSVYLDTPHQIDIMHYVCGELANDLPHLKSLQLVNAFYPFQGSSIPIVGIDTFNNLKRLDLTVITGPEMTDLLVLTPLLQSFPLLHKFHLSKFEPEDHYQPPQGEKQKQDIVFHSELKKMEITGFVGTENDIEFALYILKSAIKLEEMHITPCTKKRVESGRWNPVYEQGLWTEERQRTIITRLQGQAVSKTAQLFFQHKHQIISSIEEDCDDYV